MLNSWKNPHFGACFSWILSCFVLVIRQDFKIPYMYTTFADKVSIWCCVYYHVFCLLLSLNLSRGEVIVDHREYFGDYWSKTLPPFFARFELRRSRSTNALDFFLFTNTKTFESLLIFGHYPWVFYTYFHKENIHIIFIICGNKYPAWKTYYRLIYSLLCTQFRFIFPYCFG